MHLRVARPVSDLARTVCLYKSGLDLEELGRFVDHQGFDGVMLGLRGADFHFEFTYCGLHPVAPSPTTEDLLVFYVPEAEVWERRCAAMRKAWFKEVAPFNPYWKRKGCTFEDHDGYRTVIQQSQWSSRARPE
jgi:catechol 2,3-dioxygenase-like lactoylglutathione lyase family enzyme